MPERPGAGGLPTIVREEGGTPMTKLTPRARAILRHLWKHPHHGIERLSAAADCVKSTTAWHLAWLNHQGYIEPGPAGTTCTRRLTAKGLLAAQGYELLYTVGELGELIHSRGRLPR